MVKALWLLTILGAAGAIQQVGPREGEKVWHLEVPLLSGGVYHAAASSEVWRRGEALIGPPEAVFRSRHKRSPLISASHDGSTLALQYLGQVQLLDPATMTPRRSIAVRCPKLECGISLNRDGTLLAHTSGTKGGVVVRIFDVKSGRKLRQTRFKMHVRNAQVHFTHLGNDLLVSRAGSDLKRVDAETFATTSLKPAPPDGCEPRSTRNIKLSAWAFHPSEPLVATAWKDAWLECTDKAKARKSWVHVYSLPDWTRVEGFELTDLEREVKSLAYAEDATILAVGEASGYVRLFEASTGALLEKFPASLKFGGGLDRVLWDARSRLLLTDHYGFKYWDISAFNPKKGADASARAVVPGCHIGDCVAGEGRLVTEDGQVFEGHFRDGKLHGEGRHTTRDGVVYEGSFEAGVRHGEGKLTEPGEGTYDGEWRNGLRHGKGTFTVPGQYVLTGDYFEGRAIRGRIRFESGDRYSGELRDGAPHGTGYYAHSNGESYRGLFVNGLYEGTGTYKYENGDSWRGTWKAGKRDGFGTLRRKDGTSVSETYNAGVKYDRARAKAKARARAKAKARAREQARRAAIRAARQKARQRTRAPQSTGWQQRTSCPRTGKYVSCGSECCGAGYVCCEWNDGAAYTCRNRCTGWGWRMMLTGSP